jgi:hypothetical protein
MVLELPCYKCIYGSESTRVAMYCNNGLCPKSYICHGPSFLVVGQKRWFSQTLIGPVVLKEFMVGMAFKKKVKFWFWLTEKIHYLK